MIEIDNVANICTLEKIIVEGVVKKEYDLFCTAVGEFASKIRSLHITTDLFSDKNLQNNIYMSIHNGKTIPSPLEVSNNTRKEILSEWLINYNNNCNLEIKE